jgi:hypothetical protein
MQGISTRADHCHFQLSDPGVQLFVGDARRQTGMHGIEQPALAVQARTVQLW